MKKSYNLFWLAALLIGCDSQTSLSELTYLDNGQKTWVFAQFNVPESQGVESYFYYGEVSEQLINDITHNQRSSGFIHLHRVKYWGDENLIYAYQDQENRGDVIFRIEDLVKLVPVNKEPMVGKGVEQFRDAAPNAIAK